MALHWETFKTRTLTALLFAFIMLGGMLWNAWSFLALFSLVHFGCWHEYQKLLSSYDPGYASISLLHRYGVMIAGWSLLLIASGEGQIIFHLPLPELGWWLGLVSFLVLPLIALFLEAPAKPRNFLYSCLGILYLSCSFAFLTDLYAPWHINIDDSYYHIGAAQLVLLMIASIWINDTMAYVVGSLMGKTPLSPISPKKTWEGTVGGILLTVIIIPMLAHAFFEWGEWTSLVVGVAALAAVMGTLGDLLESKLKRMAGVKDSGHFMPGHGGFLDRFDSILLATPFVWLYIKLIESGVIS